MDTKGETIKGFVMWATDERDAAFIRIGNDVYRAPCNSAEDIRGYLQGRWECSVELWNRFAKVFGRPQIKGCNE